MPFLAEEFIDIPNKDLLSWMFDDQSYDPEKPIYVDAAEPTRTITSREARPLIRKLCAGFRAVGLEKGDCVCMLSFNDIYYPIAFLGIVAFGGIFAGSNPSHTPYELAHAFKIADVKAVIVEKELILNALKAAKEADIPSSRIFVFDHHSPLSAPNSLEIEGIKSWRTLLHHGESDWLRWDDEQRSKDTTAARLFSSGTTGLPKAVDMTHYNFIAQHTMVIEYKPKPFDIIRLLCTPMFHVSNVPRAHTSPLRSGLKTYIMRRFDLEPWLHNIQRFQISDCGLNPPMVVTIINSPLTKTYSLKSIRNAWTGAAPLAAEPQARFKALLRADAPFTQVWGMSETSCIATMLHYPEHDPTGSVGRFLPNLDSKLVDEDGRDVSGFDVVGELCVRGPLIVKGYYNNPAANQASWDEEGYFHTGDMAVRMGGNGLWYVVDRKKELIKVRAFQVAPAELEGVLLGLRGVEDAAVVGVPASVSEQDAFKGSSGIGSEFPRAYLVRKSGSRLSENDVHAYMRERLAGYKQLAGGVVFLEKIPKNVSGKILKKELREMAKREMGARL